MLARNIWAAGLRGGGIPWMTRQGMFLFSFESRGAQAEPMPHEPAASVSSELYKFPAAAFKLVPQHGTRLRVAKWNRGACSMQRGWGLGVGPCQIETIEGSQCSAYRSWWVGTLKPHTSFHPRTDLFQLNSGRCRSERINAVAAWLHRLDEHVVG